MKGILFKPEVWKAKQQVLDQYGEAQTRRVIKPQPISETMPSLGGTVANSLGYFWKGHYIGQIEKLINYARYQVGETVYVKERALYWVSPIIEGVEYDKPSDRWTDCVYQDDPDIPALLADNGRLAMERSINQIVEGSPIIGKWQWKSAMFMPEHYARHLLTITGVRGERLQEITEEDCYKEGIELPDKRYEGVDRATRYLFLQLWNSINPKYPWESNPWEFAYTFRRAEWKRS